MIWGPSGVVTAARVDLATSNNCTFQDAYQFDPTGPTGSATGAWGFTGQNFRMDIKGSRWQGTGPYLSVWGPTGGSPMIAIQDPVQRIMNFNIPEGVITGAVTGGAGYTGTGLPPGEYVYDLIMYDQSSPPVRVMLMQGRFVLSDGITGG